MFKEQTMQSMWKKNNILKTIILVLVISYVIYNVNYYNPSLPFNSFLHHYYGKDDGITRQIESTCFLSALFYFVLSTRNKMLFFLLGFVAGFLSILISIFIFYPITDNSLFGHMLGCGLFIGSFYIIPGRWKYTV
jgi:hypothetical protein